MYCAFGVCFFFFSSLFRPAHCKNWNSCGFQKSVYIYTKIHASFSLWTSLNINNNNKKKRGTTTRTISTTAKTSRKIYWPNIFDGFFLFHFVWMFCSGVLFYNRPNCVCVSWLSRQANKSFWIARISFSLSLIFYGCSKCIAFLGLFQCLHRGRKNDEEHKHFGLQQSFGWKLLPNGLNLDRFDIMSLFDLTSQWHSMDSYMFSEQAESDTTPHIQKRKTAETKITHFFAPSSGWAQFAAAYNHFITCIFECIVSV